MGGWEDRDRLTSSSAWRLALCFALYSSMREETVCPSSIIWFSEPPLKRWVGACGFGGGWVGGWMSDRGTHTPVEATYPAAAGHSPLCAKHARRRRNSEEGLDLGGGEAGQGHCQEEGSGRPMSSTAFLCCLHACLCVCLSVCVCVCGWVGGWGGERREV